MASNRIKGITIEIDGNTTKLQDSLKDVNKTIKDTQNQLKDVDKLLKLDPKNIELLAQKQELLGRQTENVADKLKKLRDAQQQMKDAGIDTMSDDYMALEREIVECENEQRKLTEEARKTDEQIVKIGSGFDKVATKAKAAADATKPLSQAAAGGLAGMAGLAVKAGQTADEITTLAKQSGIATDTIQKMQYAADMIDVDMNTAVKAVAKLKKGLDKNEDTLVSMGVAIKDQNGQYRGIEDIFMDTIQALSQIENETERDKVAMDLFGKSADELAGYIDDGGQAFRELSQMAEQSGLIISDEDLQKANEFNDKLDQLKATVGMDLLKAGSSIAEALTPALEKLAEVVTKVADGFANLSPTGQKTIMVVLAIVAAISPLLSLIATISAALPVLIPLIGAISAPVLAVVAAIAAVVAIIVILIKHWDDLKAAAQLAIEAIKTKWEEFKQKISEAVENIKAKFEDFKQGLTALKDSIAEKWDAIKEKISSVIDTIKGKIDNFKQAIQNAWNKIKSIMGGTLPTPKIKLPHIKITGSWSWNPPKAPSFSVQWYDKAMDNAYLLNGATIFGQMGNQLLGGGESGSEMVVGTETLMNAISDAMGSQNVTVVLQGDAAEIFRVVRTENQRYYKSNGYSPLTI